MADMLSRLGCCCCLQHLQKQAANKIGSMVANPQELMGQMSGEMKDKLEPFAAAVLHKKYNQRVDGDGQINTPLPSPSPQNGDGDNSQENGCEKASPKDPLKLLCISNEQSTFVVQMAVKYLKLECQIVEYVKGEKESDGFLKKNPQGVVPFLGDNGFYICESTAILQYLADAYKVDDTFYPQDPKKRAIVNHRLMFFITTYGKVIQNYSDMPVEKRLDNLEILQNMLEVFDEILTLQGTPYVAGDQVTVADLPLIMATCHLAAMAVNFVPFPNLNNYFENFKLKEIELWEIASKWLEKMTSKERPLEENKFI